MTYPDDQLLRWGVLPAAALHARVTRWANSDNPVIEVYGNRPGLVSLGIFLLQVSECGGEHESLSITGLPFVEFSSSLSLIVVRGFGEGSKVIRTDKAEQFQWLTNDEDLRSVALAIIRVAFSPPGFYPNHCDAVESSDESSAGLVIWRAEKDEDTQQTKCSEPGDGTVIDNRESTVPGC